MTRKDRFLFKITHPLSLCSIVGLTWGAVVYTFSTFLPDSPQEAGIFAAIAMAVLYLLPLRNASRLMSFHNKMKEKKKLSEELWWNCTIISTRKRGGGLRM